MRAVSIFAAIAVGVVLLITINTIMRSKGEAKYWKELALKYEWEFEQACHIVAVERDEMLRVLTDEEKQKLSDKSHRVKNWMEIDTWKDWRSSTFHSEVIPEMKAEIYKWYDRK